MVLLPMSAFLTIPSVSATGSDFMTAVIVTSHDPTLESDLAAYDWQSGLPSCTLTNGCLEIATPFGISKSNPSLRTDVSSYVEQAHQANPAAKILVVEARSISWQDKWDAMYYAEKQPQVDKVTSVSHSKVFVEIGLVLKEIK
jgi:hypothetical protein